MSAVAPLLALSLLLAGPAPGGAQERTPPAVPADTASAGGVSPGGAFARSILLPGWGQAAGGAWTRAGVFFLGHLGNAFMVVKTQGRIGDARDIETARVAVARDSIFTAAETDEALAERLEANPDTLPLLIGEDPAVRDIRKLVRAREEQREDWLAWGIFWVLASGADAFVNAHLQDFPMRLRTAPRSDGGYDVGVGLRLGARP